MKRTMVLLAIVAVCVIFLQYASSMVNAAKDTLLLETDTAINIDMLNLLKNYNEEESNIMDIGIFSRRTANFSTPGKKLEDFHVYEVNASYASFQDIQMIYGRFIWERDIREGRMLAVIEEEIAIELFATGDCVGKTVGIDGVDYQVAGVYRRNKSLLSFISTTDKNRIYISYSLGRGKQVQVFMVKVKKGLSAILEGKVIRDIEAISGVSVIVDNIDVKASKVILHQQLAYLLALVVLCVYFIRKWLHFANILKVRIKDDLSNLYTKECIKKYAIPVVLHLAPLLLMLTAVYIITRSVRFELLIDTSILPSRLIDIEQLKDNLQEYIIAGNTSKRVISDMGILIIRVSTISKVVCLLMLTAFWLCLRRLNLFERIVQII